MIARSLWAGPLLVVLVGCDKLSLDLYSCENPDKVHKDANGEPDPCHLNDPDSGTDAGIEPSCEVGQYVHWKLPWQQPTLLWVGPEEQAPECPRGPTTISYEGRADLVALPVCEACTCDPPTGSCALPSKLTASTAVCYAPGAMTSFNAPDPWDGSCDSTTQVPGGAAQSLTIDPLVTTENGCAPGLPVPAKIVSLHWETFALGCDIGLPGGPIERSACISEPLPAGFKVCIFYDGERACPNDEPGDVFTEQHVFYNGVKDDRQCSTCSCGAPTGSVCTAQLSVYEGASCSGSPLMSNPISSAKAGCLDITIPGQALGSKSVGAVTYLPGTCPPVGGDASGSAIPIEPATLCCRP